MEQTFLLFHLPELSGKLRAPLLQKKQHDVLIKETILTPTAQHNTALLQPFTATEVGGGSITKIKHMVIRKQMIYKV